MSPTLENLAMAPFFVPMYLDYHADPADRAMLIVWHQAPSDNALKHGRHATMAYTSPHGSSPYPTSSGGWATGRCPLDLAAWQAYYRADRPDFAHARLCRRMPPPDDVLLALSRYDRDR